MVISDHTLFSLLPFKFRKITVVDGEKIKNSDIEFCPLNLYSKEDINISRCEVAKRKFKYNSNIEFFPMNTKEIDKNIDLINNSDLIILCSDTISPYLHRIVNRICLKNKRTWISARYLGNIAEIGPTIIPYKTPCFTCYEYRVKSNIYNLEDYLIFENYLERKKEDYGALKMFYEIIASYLSLETIRILTNYNRPITMNAVLSVNFKDYLITIDNILKIPNCPSCGKK